MSQVLNDLLSVVPVERAFGESNQEYIRRLYEAVKSVDEDTWNAIGDKSEDAQEWYNACHHAAINGKDVLPIVPGMGNGAGVEREMVEVDEEEESSNKGKRPYKTRGKRSGELTVLIRRLVFLNPNRPAKEIQAAVAEAGFNVKLSTIATTRASTLGTLQFLSNDGYYHAPGLDLLKTSEHASAHDVDEEEGEAN